MKKIIPLVLIAVSFITAIIASPYMPYQMASHWGVSGQVDGYASKDFGLYFMPFLSLIMYILFLGLPYLEPYRKNFKEFENHYHNFMVIIFLFFFYIYLLTILWNYGLRFNMVQYLSPAFSVLFYFAGTLINHTKMNWFVGIRTPWTMSSHIVWKKTHALGGSLFKLVAVLCLVGTLFPKYATYFLLFPVLGVTVFIYIYSYWQYSHLN